MQNIFLYGITIQTQNGETFVANDRNGIPRASLSGDIMNYPKSVMHYDNNNTIQKRAPRMVREVELTLGIDPTRLGSKESFRDYLRGSDAEQYQTYATIKIRSSAGDFVLEECTINVTDSQTMTSVTQDNQEMTYVYNIQYLGA